MSSSGHYTRYINQYPGWSDNCDSMYRGIYDNDLKIKIGSITVEHTAGNKWSYCSFSNYEGISAKYGYHIREHLFECEGKLAIQAVLSRVEKEDIPAMISDVVFKAINFYKFAYLDYIERINNQSKYEPYPYLADLNEWLDCSCPCVLSDQPFHCVNMWAGTHSGRSFSDQNPVCKYFAAFIGSVGVTS